MSTDTANEALTRCRRAVELNPDAFTPEGQRKVLAFMNAMRDALMAQDIITFDAVVDEALARQPDTADFVLEELFTELRISARDHLTILLELEE